MNKCPACGESNPDSSRFCGTCGTSLSRTQSRETRKVVTVLFVDVIDSTTLGENLDPESFRGVMASYFEVASRAIERHGGTVEKFVGDAVMAIFGVPTVHEDDALRALRAAVALGESLVALNADLMQRYGISIQTRTGVNTGDVVTGTAERLAAGDTVNVAARLEAAAQAGEILIGERTWELTRGVVESELVGPLGMKGKTALVPAYRLIRMAGDETSTRAQLRRRLFGRSSELSELRHALDDAVSERRCQLITVLGPPGLGKSHLVREFGLRAGPEADVVWGRCLPYGDGITYWPFEEIFRQLDAQDEFELALSAGTPEEVFWRLRKTLEVSAGRRPLILGVEDIHWAEPTLLDLLEHLSDWVRDEPLVLLCTARLEFGDQRPGWGGRVIMLPPLSVSDSEQLIEDHPIGALLSPVARSGILDAAAGNPLFVGQMLAMVEEGGEPGQVPASIQALLAARVDRLSEEEQDLVERGSVVGLEFDWDVLTRLDGEGRRPRGALLASLVRKDLIVPLDGVEDGFSFKHMLVRDAVYERIPKARRADLHERFADWVDAKDEDNDEIAGYHLEQAYRFRGELGPEDAALRMLAERAAVRLVTSGLRADGRGDVSATVTLLDRASSLFASEDRRRLAFLPVLGRALQDLGDTERAYSVLSHAVEWGQAVGDRAIVAEAEIARTYLGFHRKEAGVGLEELKSALRQAIETFEELGDQVGLARALTVSGYLRLWVGDVAEAIEQFEQAANHAGQAGDRVAEASILGSWLIAMVDGPTPVSELLDWLEIHLDRGGGDRSLQTDLLRRKAVVEAMAGHFDTARDVMAEVKALLEGQGLYLRYEMYARQSGGVVEMLAGDAVAAERELRASCDALERTGGLGHLASAAPLLVDALFKQGRIEEAMELSDRWTPEKLTVPSDADAYIGWLRVRAKLLASQGKTFEAESLAREAVAIASKTEYLAPTADAWADLGEVLRLSGAIKEAASAYAHALELCERKGNIARARVLRDIVSPSPLEV
jgi:class 3 adenylate cyclase/tetratricopeptide (TPR) repeat protein